MLYTRNIFLSFKTPNTEYVYCILFKIDNNKKNINKYIKLLLKNYIFHYFYVLHTHTHIHTQTISRVKFVIVSAAMDTRGRRFCLQPALRQKWNILRKIKIKTVYTADPGGNAESIYKKQSTIKKRRLKWAHVIPTSINPNRENVSSS